MGIIADQQIELAWPQDQSMDLGGSYQVYADGAADAINDSPIAAWPDGVGKIGWGMAAWGAMAWGVEQLAAGWGLSPWGAFPWGQEAGYLSYTTPPLADGVHAMALSAVDAAGNESSQASASIAAAGTPEAPADLAVESYADGVLKLSFTLSNDDEGA